MYKLSFFTFLSVNYHFYLKIDLFYSEVALFSKMTDLQSRNVMEIGNSLIVTFNKHLVTNELFTAQ